MQFYFWPILTLSKESDIVIKTEGTSATKHKSPLSHKILSCPRDHQAFHTYSVGAFWIPSKIDDISSLCGESSIVSFYKCISTTGKKKYASVFQYPCPASSFSLCFVFPRRKRRGNREAHRERSSLILSLEWSLALDTRTLSWHGV